MSPRKDLPSQEIQFPPDIPGPILLCGPSLTKGDAHSEGNGPRLLPEKFTPLGRENGFPETIKIHWLNQAIRLAGDQFHSSLEFAHEPAAR